MKNIGKYGIALLLSMAMGGTFTSCTDEVGDVEINVVKGSVDSCATVDVAKGMMFQALALVHDTREHKYQYQFNLHIDNYSGYLCVANNLEGRLPSTNFMNPGFESGPLANFLWVTRQVVPVMNSAQKLEFPELGAIANIVFCYSAQEVTDVYGPIPYADYRRLKQDPPMTYMSVKDIYTDIFEQLKQSVTLLKAAQLTPEKSAVIASFDKIAGGNINNWIKFANTLRLRMALHIRKIDPAKAKLEAEAAVSAGVLESGDQNIEYNISGGRHPLFVISDSWNDTRLNASFENILKRLESPMLEHFFADNERMILDKTGAVVVPEPHAVFEGIRSGTSVFNKNDNTGAYLLFSKLNANFAGTNIAIMKVVESIFLRAEGALYGWNMGGTPQYFYEQGIRESFVKEFSDRIGNIKLRKYMALADPLDVKYADLYDSKNNYSDDKNMVQVGNKWNDGDTNERKLERIMTQKYIANFPMSLEAWTDIRRTGYPRLIPVVYDAGDHSTKGGIIRRIPFQLEGSVSEDDVFSTGVPALGGDDYQGTRLWWDVNAPNF